MNLQEAERLARELMAQYLSPAWSFGWGNKSRSAGTTEYGPKRIVLHRPFVALNERPLVEDTIRHEIAHALCKPNAGHGPAWKAMARRVGAVPRASRSHGDDGLVAPPGKYVGTCPNCKETVTRCKKTPKMFRIACAKCCRRYNGGRFDARFKFVWRETSAAAQLNASIRAATTRAASCRRCFTVHAPGQDGCE
jgi:predicted SprT family Zn-dependent metalloprotease